MVQWYWLRDMRPEADQFNSLHEKLIERWRQIGHGRVHFAAIEGHCVGGGAALVVSLDFRTCGRSAHFRIPEIELGMNMSWGSIPRRPTGWPGPWSKARRRWRLLRPTIRRNSPGG